jgi:hypothetical protein
VLKDDSTQGVLPLLGVNWFDYDFLKKKIQINVFFAGVYAFVNLTDPSLRGSKVDLGAEASLVGIKFDDKFFADGVGDVSQRIRRRSQYLTGRLGYPLGNFFKLSVIGDFTWKRTTTAPMPRTHWLRKTGRQFCRSITGSTPARSNSNSTDRILDHGVRDLLRRSKWERWASSTTRRRRSSTRRSIRIKNRSPAGS